MAMLTMLLRAIPAAGQQPATRPATTQPGEPARAMMDRTPSRVEPGHDVIYFIQPGQSLAANAPDMLRRQKDRSDLSRTNRLPDIPMIDRGRIGGLACDPAGRVWYTVDMSLKRIDQGQDQPTHSVAIDRPRRLFISRVGQGWVEGLGRFDARSGSPMPDGITPTPQDGPFPIAQDPFGNLWSLVKDEASGDSHVVVMPEGDPARRVTLGAKEGFAPGPWRSLAFDALGYLWAISDASVVRFDPRKPDAPAQRFPLEQFEQAKPTALGVATSGLMAVGLGDATVIEVDVRLKEGAIAKRLISLEMGNSGVAVRSIEAETSGVLSMTFANGREVGNSPTPEMWQRTWRELPRMPCSNHDIHAVQLDGCFYIATGKSYHGYPAKIIPFNTLWRFDPKAETWEVLPPVPTLRCYAGSAAFEGEVWVIGGHVGEGRERAISDVVEIFNPKTKQWRAGPKLPAPRTELVAQAARGRLYVIGGVGPDDKGLTRSHWSLGPGETAWRPEPETPGPVSQSSGCVVDDVIYVAVSARNGGAGLFAFDAKAGAWVKELPAMPGKAPAAPALVAGDGKVWLLGGWGGDEPAGTFWFDPKQRLWGRGSKMPAPLNWLAAGWFDNRLYLFGGAYHSPEHGDYIFYDRAFVLRK